MLTSTSKNLTSQELTGRRKGNVEQTVKSGLPGNFNSDTGPVYEAEIFRLKYSESNNFYNLPHSVCYYIIYAPLS